MKNTDKTAAPSEASAQFSESAPKAIRSPVLVHYRGNFGPPATTQFAIKCLSHGASERIANILLRVAALRVGVCDKVIVKTLPPAEIDDQKISLRNQTMQ